jgi:hypothetical protein
VGAGAWDLLVSRSLSYNYSPPPRAPGTPRSTSVHAVQPIISTF